ncbi:RNA polymerase sigma factor [Geothrix sp. PMB-07]|uniref:RNA polymerase sigma factor n=1 Tax=Geothrix sp. PMB-07 TaxID=3068640 RepID=UPI002741D32B|nr:RNA polymerase sigma factor [Geothrix sp. PMB-07]WLT31259.1 RNA polymerase sigma factor [Geothrix sp. PMB-07]
MTATRTEGVTQVVEALFQSESRRILASLIRLLGDFDLAEDGLHDAFAAALEAWPKDGVPDQPRAWLVSTGRFKAIDRLRRAARFLAPLEAVVDLPTEDQPNGLDETLEDDRLRLIFTCCHPVLPLEAATALTLREVCGLTTEAIARAFLVAPSALAQRIVRAKARIREARLPYEVPGREHLPQRLGAVLQVVYLVFNEGYSASSGATVTRPDLSEEAIRLGRLLLELLPEPEVMGLLALMLLQGARGAARTGSQGELVLLEAQDRSLWDAARVAEGRAWANRALASRQVGPYALQAAIAATHAEAMSAASTDWNRIVGLYTLLARLTPSPVVDLNRAVAVAMRDGPEAGLKLTEALMARPGLEAYHLAHAVHADLCRRLGRTEEARGSYQRALQWARQEPERRFLEKRLAELGKR